jgi:uncharacterized membrane protein
MPLRACSTIVRERDDEGTKIAMSQELQFPASKAHATNIDTVVRLEAEQEKHIPHTNRFSEAIARFAGTNIFIVTEMVGVALWIAINTGALRSVPVFDPYPFGLLAVVLGLEAVLLTAFVLIRQNRMSEKADRRSHLDLQINLLAEKEVTKVIQLLQRMSRQMGMEEQVTDLETRELSKDTEVEDVARFERKSRPRAGIGSLTHPRGKSWSNELSD